MSFVTRMFDAKFLAAAVVLASALSVQAEQIAVDPFLSGGTPANGEYYVGDLASSNGNQDPTVAGFTGAWAGGTGVIDAVSTGLDYTDLVTSGGAIRFLHTSSTTIRDVDRALDTSYDMDRSVYYLSGLMSFDSNFDTAATATAFTGFLNAVEGEDDLVLGMQWGFQGNGDAGVDAILRVRGTDRVVSNVMIGDVTAGTHLFVLKVEPNYGGASSDKVSVWLNPTSLSSESAAGTATLVNINGCWVPGDDDPDRVIDTLVFNATEVGANAPVGYDQVHFGETWGDVVVPEPSTLVLLGIGSLIALAVGIFRRRRA